MHIAILNDANNFHTQKWAKNIAASGAKVSIICFDDFHSSEVPVIALKPRFSRDGFPNFLSFLMMGREFAEVLEQEKVDVVFAINVTPYGILARKTRFKPCILFAVGMDILEFPPKDKINVALQTRNWNNQEEDNSFLSKLKYAVRHFIVRKEVKKALDFADVIMGDNLVLTNATETWFDIPNAKIRLNRGGVEPKLFEVGEDRIAEIRKKYAIPSDKKIVLVPRGLKPIYQADIIVDAIECLQKQGRKDVYFIVLGTYSAISSSIDKQLLALSQSSGLLLYQKEMVAREEMYALWNCIDAFVSAPIYDGYSATVAEGRYAGAIPIVNDTAATRELFQHQENAWIVAPFTAKNLANELNIVLDKLAFWKEKFADTNHQWVEKNSLMAESATKVVKWAQELYKKQ